MRTILGMLLGSVMTVLAAYVSDATAPVTGAPPMVNWEVAGERLHNLAVLANDKISRFLRS